jgi:TRAP transporter 4TM/12TM fusion protein
VAESRRPEDDDAAVSAPHRSDAAPTDAVHPQRELGGIIGKVTTAIAVSYSTYYLFTAQFGITSPQAHRGFYWGFAGVLIFLLYPWRTRSRQEGDQRVPVWDIALSALVAVLACYFVFRYPAIVSRGGVLTQAEVVMGALAVLLSLEMTRRVVGWMLTGIGVVVIVYSYYGPQMPGIFAHGGYEIDRFLSTAYGSFNGIFGSVADIFATYVFIFIVFGAFMQKSGAGQFFVDLPFAIAGKTRGGPAKVAVMVSAIMGSVNGSPVANVMTTGTFTIPLMRRVGYSKEFSGGVEAAASVGGQMLPPVMGAGAFLIAEFTQTSYTTIVLVSIVPALLYFLSVYLLVDFQALRRNLQGLPASELPDWKKVLKQGWYFLIPLALLFTLVVMRFSPAFAGFWAVMAVIVIGVLVPYRGHRMGVRDIVAALRSGAVASLTVGAVVGTIGIVIGVVDLTGLGLRFSDLIVDISGGNLLAALVLVTLVSWILGAGLTVTSSYIMVAILAAPALTEMGVSLLVAHLIVFWVSQDANVTPPIALASFAASGISGGKPMRTAWESWLLARGLYIVPFLMAFTPLIDGPVADAVPVVISAVLGIYALSAGMSGYLRRRATWYEQVLLLAGGVLLIAPGIITNVIGAALAVAAYVIQRLRPGRPSGEAALAEGSRV